MAALVTGHCHVRCGWCQLCHWQSVGCRAHRTRYTHPKAPCNSEFLARSVTVVGAVTLVLVE